MDIETEKENVGAGWRPLVEMLHSELKELDPDYTIEQIKEKFGGLRYYFSVSEAVLEDEATQQKMYELCSATEARSFEVCEACGEEGELDTSSHWVKTLCATHKEERRAYRQKMADEMNAESKKTQQKTTE